MAVNISKLNVLLAGSAAGLIAACNQGSGALTSFGGSFTSVAGIVAGAGAAIGVSLSAASAVDYVKRTYTAIDANAKLADSMGVTTEALTGLQYAGSIAGVSTEQLTGGLQKMLKTIGGVADNGTVAADVFSKIGLSAKTLANSSADEAFATIAQRLKEIPNAAERAAATTQIFGKAGQNLLPLLMTGAQGIKAAEAEAKKLGLTYSRVDAAKIEQANDAITRTQAVLQGATNQLAIQLAPLLEGFANKLTDIATKGGGLRSVFLDAFETAVTGAATAADYLELFKAGWDLLKVTADIALTVIVSEIDAVANAIEYVINKIPGVHVQITATLDALRHDMIETTKADADAGKAALERFSSGANSKAAAKFFDDIRIKSTAAANSTADAATKKNGAFQGIDESAANLKKITDGLDDLQKRVDQFGLSEGQKKLADLAAAGAKPDQLALAKSLSDQYDALEAQKKITDELAAAAKSMFEDTETPAEKYIAQLEKINELLAAGKIGNDTAQRAAEKLRADLLKADRAATQTEAPKLLEAGTQATYQFIEQSQRKQRDEAAAQRMLKAQIDGNALLQKIADKITPSTGSTTINTVSA